ncbi:putative lipoprotein [Desulfamplus magnetovallimortis]|uniref:Putative lipoprotein n=1 Tax=Desulfamplus magnetovallimortis TaxID=1246637 RepID=A0A1W1HB58_9BACT|nr:nuclear transport factor 2 family protein [Desulfamplus magnetovallimortis]SLM29673.1 putative lipoprotein [Desulfamplus magnetovallimortis]
MKKSIVFCFAVLFLVSCASIQANNAPQTELSNKDKVIALLNSLETGDPAPVGYINPDNYIQHNLMVGDGLAGFGELLKNIPQGSLKVNVIRAFSDGDYVFTHTDYNFFGPKAGFDIFRFEDGKIVEHWDNLSPKAETPNPSGHTQFDGPTQATDLSKTKHNKLLVKDFVNTILVKGEFDKLGNYFDGDNYIQHNSAIADGVSGLGNALDAMAKQGITMVYHANHLILGEGNFVLAVSEGEFAGKPTSFYDLFRIENNKIAEHWDVMETIIPENERKNANGKFGFK